MPYIKSEERTEYDATIDLLVEKLTEHGNNTTPQPGHVNYVVSRMLWGILKKNGMSYTRANNLIGALECIKLEMYRRLLADYEDDAIKRNGDMSL